MAERQFVIRIVNDTQGNAGDKVGGAGGIGKMNKTNSTEKLGDFVMKKAGVPLTGMAMYGTVRKITNEIVSHNNSLIQVKTGSREQQERQTFIYNTATGFLDAAVTGASAGFMAVGALGAGLGALLGVTKQGLSMAINVAKTSDILAKNKQLENIQRELQTQKVTVSGSRYMNALQT